jgi:tetratricopeptide (TPR) repeat protein
MPPTFLTFRIGILLVTAPLRRRSKEELKMTSSLSRAVLVLFVLAGAPAARADVLDLLAQGKTETDLGHYDLAIRAFAAVTEAKEASPAQRAEALVRLAVARRGNGDFQSALSDFQQAAKAPGRDAASTALLVQALGGALPGPDRWERIWSQLSFPLDRSDARRPTLVIAWPGLPERRSYTGDAVSFEFKDGELHDVFRLIADVSGLNVVVHPGVRGRVTFAGRNVPWDSALDRILAANGLTYQWNDNVLHIAAPEQLSPPRRFSGNRLDVELSNRDLKEALTEIAVTGGATVVLDPTVAGRVTLKLNQVRWDQAFDVVVRVNGLDWSRKGDTLEVSPRKKGAAR